MKLQTNLSTLARLAILFTLAFATYGCASSDSSEEAASESNIRADGLPNLRLASYGLIDSRDLGGLITVTSLSPLTLDLVLDRNEGTGDSGFVVRGMIATPAGNGNARASKDGCTIEFFESNGLLGVSDASGCGDLGSYAALGYYAIPESTDKCFSRTLGYSVDTSTCVKSRNTSKWYRCTIGLGQNEQDDDRWVEIGGPSNLSCRYAFDETGQELEIHEE